MYILNEQVYFYHYFEKSVGPFINLSEIDIKKATAIQNNLKGVFASRRNSEYLIRRKYLEQLVRGLFIKKGGKPKRQTPYYMTVGKCDWLMTWYKEAEFIRIPSSEFNKSTISFTYGDMFPTFSDKVTDNLEYRKNVYTYDEIIYIIEKYGMPQDKWDGSIFAQPAYVEVQVWDEKPIDKYKV